MDGKSPCCSHHLLKVLRAALRQYGPAPPGHLPCMSLAILQAHRGHAIFDTAIIAHGALYLLDRHLDRFLHSAYRAGLALPYSLDQLARIIIETAAIGGAFTGGV